MSIFTVNGSAVFKSETNAGVSRVSLDFSGDASLIYLGTVGSTAGRFIMTTSDTGMEFWGVARLDFNLSKLQPLGVDADLYSILVVNSTSSAKTETITLKGQAKDGTDKTDTWTLRPQLLGIEAAGTLSLHIGNGQPGKPIPVGVGLKPICHACVCDPAGGKPTSVGGEAGGQANK